MFEEMGSSVKFAWVKGAADFDVDGGGTFVSLRIGNEHTFHLVGELQVLVRPFVSGWLDDINVFHIFLFFVNVV